MDNRNSLECGDNTTNTVVSGATFTFSQPGTGKVENTIVAEPGINSYPFTIHPSNESLVTCTLNSVVSDPVGVAGMYIIQQF